MATLIRRRLEGGGNWGDESGVRVGCERMNLGIGISESAMPGPISWKWLA